MELDNLLAKKVTTKLFYAFSRKKSNENILKISNEYNLPSIYSNRGNLLPLTSKKSKEFHFEDRFLNKNQLISIKRHKNSKKTNQESSIDLSSAGKLNECKTILNLLRILCHRS